METESDQRSATPSAPQGGGSGRGDSLSAFAKANRRKPTEPEQRLWGALRAHRLNGIPFARQVPVAGYILDFAARRERVGIEIDGHTHTDPVAEQRRTAAVEAAGYRLLRFQNRDVMENLPGVLLAIASAVPPPRPSPRRGEGEDALPLPAGEGER